MKKKLPKYLLGVVFIGLGAIICLPVLLLVSGSLADSLEWRQRAGGYLRDTREYIAWRWIPAYPTLEHYKRLLFFSPAFFRLFWNSLGMTGSILLGQLAGKPRGIGDVAQHAVAVGQAVPKSDNGTLFHKNAPFRFAGKFPFPLF